MVRTGLAVFSAFIAIGVVSSPAKAGDYYYSGYRTGYYDRGYERSYQSSSCCYRRVVRYERVYRNYDRPYYRPSYYSTGYDNGPYYGGSRYYSGSSYTVTNYDQTGGYYGSGCRPIRYRVYDDSGGWVWGRSATCY